MGWLPRTKASVAPSDPEPRRQSACAVDVRSGDVEQDRPFGDQKISGSRRSDTELHTTESGFCFSLTLIVP